MMPCACAIGVTPEELEDIWDEEDGRELLLDRLVDIEFEERMQPQQVRKAPRWPRSWANCSHL